MLITIIGSLIAYIHNSSPVRKKYTIEINLIIFGEGQSFTRIFLYHYLWSRPYSATSITQTACYRSFGNGKEFCLLSSCNICTILTSNEKGGFSCQKISQIAMR